MREARLIAVVGATGEQGGGVVKHLLADTEQQWTVRALTRNAESSKSQQLLSRLQTEDNRLSLGEAHVHDLASLESAFAGAYGVFAMTSNQKEPGEPLLSEEDVRHEIIAGGSMVNAAKANGVRHFVFSSLPDIIKGSNGKFRGATNMNNKVFIEKFARKELDCFTSIVPVLCVGAGFAELMLAHRVKQHDFIDLCIYEKNVGIGGTWFENNYPGAACDVRSNIYTFPFAPNPNWSRFHAQSGEILAYIQDVADRFGLMDMWTVTVERTDGTTFTDEAEILVNRSGILNRRKLPDIPGLEQFQGPVVHSAV